MERDPKFIAPEEAAALLLREAKQLWEKQSLEESLLRLKQVVLLLRQSIDRDPSNERNLEALEAIRADADQFWALADGASAFWRGAGTVSGLDPEEHLVRGSVDGKVEED